MKLGDIMKHEMKLQHGPFLLIENGSKTIELRLNDEKRKKVKVGDKIVFTDQTTGMKMITEVIALHPYQSFKELYQHFSPNVLGYQEGEAANPKDMELYYSLEEQEKYGVLGIEIKKQGSIFE